MVRTLVRVPIRGGFNEGDEGLLDRVQALENGLRSLRREAAELRAAHDDAIELALIGAVPNGIFRLVADAKNAGWLVTYRRGAQRADFGAICFEHPEDSTHDCTIALPVSENEGEQRRIEMNVRMRIGLLRAA